MYRMREDHAQIKRVELHCHTGMSRMDGVAHAGEIIFVALKWGMPAIAITDHAVVQGLVEGHQYLRYPGIKGIEDFKLICGMEGYLADDMDDAGKSHHVSILVINETGRINLYRLVSLSHLEYLREKPLIPRSVLEAHREGLLIGSACYEGELFEALAEGRPEEELDAIVGFYDYLEIQPVSNHLFLTEDPAYPRITSAEDLKALNREIVRLGEKHSKPVVATSDAHFVNPEGEKLRDDILVAGGSSEKPAPLYLRTTDEMLEEFAYLGADKAMEVVVTNTRRIADMCGNVPPVRADRCLPVIEGSDEILRESCHARARELYGEDLPSPVAERLDEELDHIIGNGYSVHYVTAMKLVEKSQQMGYPVGSRGSVGASFAAYTAGITDVNPLPPHYRCPACHHFEFAGEETDRRVRSGYDLPDKVCPVCGKPMEKDGFNIGAELFLGFDGDIEPDIDLNFAGTILEAMHAHMEEIFGAGNCFRAGNILESNTDRYVKNRGGKYWLHEKDGEGEVIVMECPHIVKTVMGMHPGGVIVVPRGEDINSFTPLQHPYDRADSPLVITHFDFHMIDHNLVKFDLLRHDDPTVLGLLHESTGVDPREIPFDDPAVMALFEGGDTEGIPEFGSEQMQVLVKKACPHSFADLVGLSGLLHGTGTWLGNAEELIDAGTATLSDCICCRDDIMDELLRRGMDRRTAFTVMQSVRKGKGLTDEMEEAMREAGVPGWYIDSCRKIRYLFPRAHAAAYVMMAWRIAYYKVYYPEAHRKVWTDVRGEK